jgi:hypothetical protein
MQNYHLFLESGLQISFAYILGFQDGEQTSNYIVMLVHEIILIIFMVFGIFGNLANFYAFNHHTMRTHSTFRFLTYLSLVDLLCVVIGIPHVLIVINKNYDFRNSSDIACKIHSFLTYYTTHVSSNLLAAVSVDRVFAITRLKPNKTVLKKAKNNPMSLTSKFKQIKMNLNEMPVTTAKSKAFTNVEYAVLLILLVIFFFDFHFLYWLKLNDYKNTASNHTDDNSSDALVVEKVCYPSNTNNPLYFKFYTSTWVWIDLGLYGYIPFVVMSTCTALIIYRLVRLNRAMRFHSKPVALGNNDAKKIKPVFGMMNWKKERSATVKISKLNTEIAKRRARKNKQIYNLLLCLNLLFFIMVTPVVTLNSFGILTDGPNSQVITIVVYLLAYANHTFNFIFYGFSCKRYREIFIDLYLKYKQKLICNKTPSKPIHYV